MDKGHVKLSHPDLLGVTIDVPSDAAWVRSLRGWVYADEAVIDEADAAAADIGSRFTFPLTKEEDDGTYHP